MSKKKHLHGMRGKGGFAKQLAFFSRHYPHGTRNGYPQIKKTAPSAANTESGRVEQNLPGTVSASIVPQEKEEKQV